MVILGPPPPLELGFSKEMGVFFVSVQQLHDALLYFNDASDNYKSWFWYTILRNISPSTTPVSIMRTYLRISEWFLFGSLAGGIIKSWPLAKHNSPPHPSKQWVCYTCSIILNSY